MARSCLKSTFCKKLTAEWWWNRLYPPPLSSLWSFWSIRIVLTHQIRCLIRNSQGETKSHLMAWKVSRPQIRSGSGRRFQLLSSYGQELDTSNRLETFKNGLNPTILASHKSWTSEKWSPCLARRINVDFWPSAGPITRSAARKYQIDLKFLFPSRMVSYDNILKGFYDRFGEVRAILRTSTS